MPQAGCRHRLIRNSEFWIHVGSPRSRWEVTVDGYVFNNYTFVENLPDNIIKALSPSCFQSLNSEGKIGPNLSLQCYKTTCWAEPLTLESSLRARKWSGWKHLIQNLEILESQDQIESLSRASRYRTARHGKISFFINSPERQPLLSLSLLKGWTLIRRIFLRRGPKSQRKAQSDCL